MKFKTTRKAVVNGSANLRCCGYCELQTLLRNHEPVAYTCGVYGWNFDVYEVHGLTICTGYRGMAGSRLKGCTEAEKAAREIVDNYSITWEERDNKVEELLHEFCKANGGY